MDFYQKIDDERFLKSVKHKNPNLLKKIFSVLKKKISEEVEEDYEISEDDKSNRETHEEWWNRVQDDAMKLLDDILDRPDPIEKIGGFVLAPFEKALKAFTYVLKKTKRK